MDSADGNCLGNGNSIDGDERDAFGSYGYGRQNNVARMPTERDSCYYNMNHKYRGHALLFNHEKFNNISLKARAGTQTDCENFKKQLKRLGFKVTVYHDLDYGNVINGVKEAAETDHTDYDCFLLAVLSHGEMNMLYAKDVPYKPDELWKPFTSDRCPTLAGKPKLFIIQACQGDRLDPGVTLARTETDGHPSNTYRIPIHADFLIAYSTIPGHFSWRNTAKGAWFMQALCEELEHNGFTHDLLTILTFVCRRVAIDYESNTPDNPIMHRQKQIPCITTMLTRLLSFSPKQ